MSTYQKKIIDALKAGAKLQSNEGRNYKTWLIHTDGSTERIRRDSAEKVCIEFDSKLVFGEWGGIRWRK